MTTKTGAGTLSWRWTSLYAAGATAAFHLAYGWPALSVLIVAYLFCLYQLARARTGRQAFYTGLAVGLLTVGPQLKCFQVIFGPAAIELWLIIALWIGMFAALARLCLARLGAVRTALLAPFLWTGLEYFRSELYYLRFSWLNVGYAFSGNLPPLCFGCLGMYGIGFLAMAIAAGLSLLRPLHAGLTALTLAAVMAAMPLLKTQAAFSGASDARVRSVQVAGVQLEFPFQGDVTAALDRLLAASPGAELLVLSEYTFLDAVPNSVKQWCRAHHRHLIVGGEDPASKGNYYNTAFVIDPAGEIVFRQVKCVPIQFFKDGLPAPEQKLWESPWGRIGICICYDLCYTRVTDRLIRLGAEAFVVPTMDVADWGWREHELHARVAPVRAAEYGVPIFRVASSGISQLVDRSGRETAKTGFPGEGEMISGRLCFDQRGSLPLDRWLAPFASGVTGVLMLWFLIQRGPGRPPKSAGAENQQTQRPQNI